MPTLDSGRDGSRSTGVDVHHPVRSQNNLGGLTLIDKFRVFCRLWYHHHQNGTQEAIAIYDRRGGQCIRVTWADWAEEVYGERFELVTSELGRMVVETVRSFDQM